MAGAPDAVDRNSPRFTEGFTTPPYQTPLQNAQASPPIPQYTENGAEQPEEKSPDSKYESYNRQYMSPGLESVRDQEAGLEVYHQPEPPAQPREQPESSARVCGIAKKWFYALIALIVIIVLGIGLGVGLGVGLNSGSSNSSSASPSSGTANSNYLIGGALNSSYYSTSSVFNGTGIAFATQAFQDQITLTDDPGEGVVYFQYYDGSIRWIELNHNLAWIGGSSSQIAASNAKNNTPLSAVSYVSNVTSIWHLFYVDTDNYLRERINSNASGGIWTDGPLNMANIQVNDQEQVGMQACWYGNDYGDSGYKHSPLPPSTPGAQFSNKIGMNLWYAKDNTTFAQWGWRDGDQSWTHVKDWPNFNGHAGVGCYSWGPGGYIYTTLVNLDNEIEFWWLYNTNLTNVTTPKNVWTRANYTINGVHPSTSMGYTNILYAQLADSSIEGYNISWAGENTTLYEPSFQVTDSAIPGTHLSVTAIPLPGGGNDLYVFCQTIGNEITQFVRNFYAGNWFGSELPGIPPT